MESIDYLLAQVCRLHHARAHVLLERLGLYRGQPPVLHALWEKEGRTHSELAERLNIQPATVTKMIKRMERAGFLVSRQDPEDQRVYRVYLTEKGRAIQEDVRQIMGRLEEEAFAGFNLEERVLLRRFFIQIRDNLLRTSGAESSH
ncbi:MAG: MarR family winged helix-turn-helix transcriptional regulator [bacterium]